MISLGAKVYLRACRAGEPGTVVRQERGKLVVYWRDLDYWSRHKSESLEPVSTTPEMSNAPTDLQRKVQR